MERSSNYEIGHTRSEQYVLPIWRGDEETAKVIDGMGVNVPVREGHGAHALLEAPRRGRYRRRHGAARTVRAEPPGGHGPDRLRHPLARPLRAHAGPAARGPHPAGAVGDQPPQGPLAGRDRPEPTRQPRTLRPGALTSRGSRPCHTPPRPRAPQPPDPP